MKVLRNLLSKIKISSIEQSNPKVAEIIEQVREKHLTYLAQEALSELLQVAIANENKNVEGIIIEAGCALGGSAIALAAAKNKNRELWVYDVFGMIPPPSEKDGEDVHNRYEEIKSGQSTGIAGKTYYGYEENLYEKVRQELINFGFEPQENNIHLVKGLFQDTLVVDSPVSLAHIDCDWYDSVSTCLSRIEPHLIKGGVLVIDDYYAWSGCKTAVDDYFKDKQEYEFIQKARLHIVKK